MTDKKKPADYSQYIKPGTSAAKPGTEGDPFDSGEAKSDAADFDRNRSGAYGGRPEQRGYDPKKENDPSANERS